MPELIIIRRYTGVNDLKQIFIILLESKKNCHVTVLYMFEDTPFVFFQLCVSV
jgi:NAD(P)H-flavin reductase